ncbi:MAG TPA: alpha/beta hydrolase [Actinoplanes sp.]|nr:alpha/beta hydrolase [Actinoplanes sp.]
MTTTRRSLLIAAAATGIAVPLGALPAGASPALLSLPRPTGPHRIGVVDVHLTGPGRELMTSIWYPAADGPASRPVAPWMAEAPMRALLAGAGFPAVAAPHTSGRHGAPPVPGRRPVIVFSHGSGGHRSETTIIVQELASHGYAVVTVDHSGDSFTEFPGGRLVVPAEEPRTPWDYTADLRFVLDRLDVLAAAAGTEFDPERIGMFGWSKGATATALTMNTDSRVRAGLGLDGPMQSNPAVTAIDRPFLLMTADFTRAAEPAVDRFWSLLTGWRRGLYTCGTTHSSYCDHQWLIPQLAVMTGMSDEDLKAWIGTLAPPRAVRIQQAYPLAFFDQHLRNRRSPLLDGPSRAFPEVRFVR